MNDFASLWSYLSATPLLWLTATIGAYLIADNLAGRLGNPPWANPVLLSVLLLSPVLVFTNTRSQTEMWYQKILEVRPDWAGWMAMHHGSLDSSIRNWVENALHEGILKVVVCTSSLDLGVDFRPVDRVIQIGSPKGVSRFVQRAGRAGQCRRRCRSPPCRV